ncbi:MAG: hypothetical protein LBH32_06395, partial [Dysgonamonadaceae bacterium]|nr:hypothetical protein [Dysgonamonadaceae bacterium]
MTKRAVRFFNTTGPCNPDDHYMLPPEDRLKGAQLHRYINDKLYWVLHAPRQTGKTTFLQNWMREINASREDVVACYVSVETCQGISDINKAMRTIYSAIRFFSKTSNIPIPTLNNIDSEGLVQEILSKWAELVAPKSLIVLFDEVDVLEGEPMISFLRQLRGGFAKRGAGSFPISIVLVGLRDLKDYITKLKDGVAPNPGSPFNIKEDSAVIGNFSQAAVAHLFAQRTEETGQQITQEALDYVWELSKGQPWIVNNLFKRATMRVLDANDYSTVTYDHIREACEQMVLARETHLDIDSLANRLDDPRIRIVMGKMISGETDTNLVQSEGFRLCMDWGLVVIENGSSQVVNPIYREMLAREMTYGAQLAIPEPNWRWQKNDGTLDMDNLMREFQKFWRKHSAVW